MLSPPRSSYPRSEFGSPRSPRQAIQVDRHSHPGADLIRKRSRQGVKVSHQKVRTGCLRCKQRRVKCDETQPHCLRCRRIKLPCPGYQQPVTRIFGLSTLEGFDSDFEKLCFDSFFAGGSARLALFQPSSTSFWSSVLPQLCQVHLPLRHAAIAIAYVNEPFYNPTIGQAARSVSPLDTLGVVMTHFNKALRIFNAHVHYLSVEAKVSCCIIFTALTIYMYRVGAVSSHVSVALHFLQQHEAEERHGNPVLKQVLTPMIHRLVIDACTFSGGMNGYQDGDDNPYEEYSFQILKVPITFDTYQDAYETVCTMLKYSIAASVGNIKHGSRVHVLLQSTFRRFYIVLTESNIESCAGKHLSNKQIEFHRKDLLLQHRVAWLISCFRPNILECSYWVFAPEFRAVFDQMKELIENELEDPWRVTLGWIPPLFLVATKCRISTLRREALHLMHHLHRVERGWTSCVAYALAKFVIDQEEPTSLHDPATAYFEYVRLLSVKFNHDEQLATVRYLLQRDRTSLGMFSAQLPMKALSKTLTGAPAMNIPDPVLQAFGYTGTTMFSPRVQCHCHDTGELVRYKGKVTKSGKEEVVVWQAGMATFKAVKEQEQEQDFDADLDRIEADAEDESYDYGVATGTRHQAFQDAIKQSTVPVLGETLPVPGD